MKRDNNYNFQKIFIIVTTIYIILLYTLPGFPKIVIKETKINKIKIGINNYTDNSVPKKITRMNKLHIIQSFKEQFFLEPNNSLSEITTNSNNLSNKEINKNKKTSRIEQKIKLNKAKDILSDGIIPVLTNTDSNIKKTASAKITLKKGSKREIEKTSWETLTNSDSKNTMGSKSGLKYASLDGKSSVIWNPDNKNPKYPLEAEKNAQTANVKIILDVGITGKVSKVTLTKTGVDAIDRAVERVAHSWNVKLINNGMAISGRVMVIYDFSLKSKE